MIVMVDTSAIIAVSDKRHPLCQVLHQLMLSGDNLYIIPSTVATEACYILNNRFGPGFEIRLIKEIIETNFLFEPVLFEDLSRIVEILIKYKDLNLGFTDGSIVAIAERLKTNKILTLDRKHFDIVVPKGFDYFDILV